MRHRQFGKILGRNHNQRQALLRSLLRSLLTYSSINTTQAKAKSVQPLVEKISSQALKNTPASKQQIFKYLQDKKWVDLITQRIQASYADQKSNFTKITPVKRRFGDDALIVKLAFTKPVSFKPDPIVKPTKTTTKPAVKKPAKTTK